MPRCLHCGSCNTTENHIHSGHDAIHCIHASHLIGPVLAGALWLLKKAVNAMEDSYRCKTCNKTFS